MKDKQTQMWIPLYVDKWIFGSTRIELEPAERGVFIDLMVLAAKDSGYIRANETTPYLPVQIAGLLNIPVELLISTVAKCVHFGKIEEPTPGIYRLMNWGKFQLSEDYKYRIHTGRKQVPGAPVRQNSDCGPTKPGPIREDKREEYIQKCNGFVEFWKAYPRKTGKAAAESAWKKSKPPLDKCLKALAWQSVSQQWTKDKGQYIPLPATWINQGRWDDEPVRNGATAQSRPIPAPPKDEWKPEYNFDPKEEKMKMGAK